jgi:acyl-coenzyme A synthetase/AMP-(fatty) acid ligase
MDEQGRLWFCGRKSERVVTAGLTLFTTCVEPRFYRHPLVQQAALVGARGKAVLVVEPKPGAKADAAAAAGILALRGGLPIEQILFKAALPLDGRHAAKILRGQLARWAERRVA